MSNKITKKYFKYSSDNKNLEKNINQVLLETNFKIEKEIFRGVIYDQNKVGSIIYKGKWKNKTAILKIQFLKIEIDEVEIIKKFNGLKKFRNIRAPRLFDYKKWNAKSGYGYLITEYIDAPQIYNAPLATDKQIKTFVNFYKNYKEKISDKPFLRIAPDKNIYNLTERRVNHWLKIAQAKKTLDNQDKIYSDKFLALAKKYSPKIKMQFMHGHLMSRDIYQINNEKFVLMSNLFWSYRPEYYDAAFNLWAGIKSIRDLKIKSQQVIEYTQKWCNEYKKLDFIKKDYDFEKKFNIMILERCIGALLVDIDNQDYENKPALHKKHLKTIFRKLFDYYF
ncbi:MAG: hypothetical protein PHT51_01935 [Patescibacteria group bacterium]|nr:hypothetical protein [Patescibacteria group bacterium]MDD4610342.1 hypothetical protein [Patescibacteria group bacterium]